MSEEDHISVLTKAWATLKDAADKARSDGLDVAFCRFVEGHTAYRLDDVEDMHPIDEVDLIINRLTVI